jgi:iron complex outermembrane receptor protein
MQMQRTLFSLLILLVAVTSVAGQVLHGHVIDAATRMPVEGAVVSVEGAFPVVTCNHGEFTLELAAGDHAVQVSHVAYAAYSAIVSVTGDLHLDISLERINVRLDEVTVFAPRQILSSGSIDPVVLRPGPEHFNTDVNLHLGALLRQLPGVSSVNTGASAGLPWIRGLGGSRVGVFIDGVPQQNQQWAVDHGSDIDPWMAERIRVYKGPSTLLFGPNASAGVVAVDQASPMTPQSFSVGVFGRGQSVNDGYESGLKLAKRWKRLQIEIRGIVREYADLRVPASDFVHLSRVLPIVNERLVNTSGESNAQQLRLRWENGNNSSWRLEARRSFQETGIFPGIFGIPTIPMLQGDGDARLTALPRMTSEHRALSLVHERTGEWGDLRFTAGWQQSHRQELGPPHSHGNAPLPNNPLALDLSLSSAFASIHAERKIGANRRIFSGAQLEALDNRSSGWEFLVSDYSSATAGAFVGMEGLVSFFGGRMDGGFRIDAAWVQTSAFEEPVYDTNQQVIGSALLSDAVSEAFPGISANLLWSRNLNAHRLFTVQLARSIRFPTAYELSANGVHHGTFRHEQGNADLQTEAGYQLDVNIAGFNDALNWELSPFVGYYDNFIFLAPAGRFSTLPHAGQLYAFEQAQVFRSGAELTLRYRWQQTLLFTLTGEYLMQYNLDEGMALPWTPPLKGELHVKWQPQKLPVYIRGTYTAVASQNAVDRNEVPTEGYSLGSVAIGGNLAQSLKWSAYVSNVFDARYIDHLSRYKLLNLPEAGRNFGFLLIYEFNSKRT